MALEHLNASRAPQNGRKYRRMLALRCARKRRVERQELGLRIRVAALGHQHLAHGRTVVQRFNRKESGKLFAVFVHILEQYAVRPNAEPRIDALGADRTLRWVETAQRLLDALQTVLALARHRRAQIEDAAPANWR